MRYKLIILAMGLFLLKINTWLMKKQVEIRSAQEQEFINYEFNRERYTGHYLESIRQTSRTNHVFFPDCMKIKESEKKLGRPFKDIIEAYYHIRNCDQSIGLKPLPSVKWTPDLLDTILLDDFAYHNLNERIDKYNRKEYYKYNVIKLVISSVKTNGDKLLVELMPIVLVDNNPLEAEINGKYIPATNPVILSKNQVLTSWRIQNPITHEYQVFKHQ